MKTRSVLLLAGAILMAGWRSAGAAPPVPAARANPARGEAPEAVPAPPSEAPAPTPFVKGSWTLVVLPDTQVYAMSYPTLFEAQAEWIVENRQARNIAYVLHLGDVTNNNNEPQWEVAKRSLSKLDGLVPYAIAPGNHDYGPGGGAGSRETLFHQYFPVDMFQKWPTFGETFEKRKADNSYHLFRAGGTDWIVLALEWGPRDEVVAWADKILREHPDRRGILITHAYLYSDDTRYDWAQKGALQKWNPHSYPTAGLPGGVNDGEELWQKLVKKHPSMVLIINGHVLHDGLGTLSSQGDRGNTVHQMLVNFQMHTRGGDAFLRLIEFLPDGKTVQVKTYSPDLKTYKTDLANQFTLTLDPPLKPW